MTTEPREFLAFLGLQAALRRIDSGAHPDRFYNRVEDVAVKLDPDQDVAEIAGVFPLVVIEPTDDEFTHEPAMQSQIAVGVRVSWLESVTPPEDATAATPRRPSDLARLRAFYRACLDVETAIADDVGLGGVVTDTRIASRKWNRDTNGQHVLAEIEIVMNMRRS